MVRRDLRTLWFAGVVISVLAIIGVAVVAVAVFIEGRQELSNARELACRRPEAKVFAASELPDVNGISTYWFEMAPFQGGALVVGRSAPGGHPVLVALDSRGVARAQADLPTNQCAAMDLVAVSRKNAVVLCANASRLQFIGVDLRESRLTLSTLPQGDISWASSSMHQVLGATAGTHHFWVSPKGTSEWAIGSGDGFTAPIFADLPGVSEVSDLTALSDSLAAVVTSEKGVIRIMAVTPSGQIVRSVTVAEGARNELSVTHARALVDHSEILVIWLEERSQPLLNSFAPRTSKVVFRRFNSALIPLSEREVVSEDPFVVPFRVSQGASRSIVAWDQGVREAWEVASFVELASAPAHSKTPVLRIPSGRLPIAMVETDSGVLALLSKNDSTSRPYSAVLFGP